MTQFSKLLWLPVVCALILLCAFGATSARRQEPAPPAAQQVTNPAEASPNAPDLPAQLELLETRVRFEENGDSRKEVHTRVHINNEVGARQFARLAFDYNRSFQQIEFPVVRITHSGGGTVDILPSAISDQPNPAVVNAPAYQDVRVKSVRILGLAPGDVLEYRVITITSHHPLAPDFWLDHTFDRSGIVSHEVFELDLPASRVIQMKVNKALPPEEIATGNDSGRIVQKWRMKPTDAGRDPNPSPPQAEQPDIVLTSFSSWNQLAHKLAMSFVTGFSTADWEKVMKRVGASHEPVPKHLLYDFVSKKIATVDLPLDPERFGVRQVASEILASGYGTPEDKLKLLKTLLIQDSLKTNLLLCTMKSPEQELPRPSVFTSILLAVAANGSTSYLDPSVQVAPFGAVKSSLRGRKALVFGDCPNQGGCWTTISSDLPFPSFQRVHVDAAIGADGTLSAKVKYRMRGDNELLLRVAFHESAKEKWKEVAQLLALSDGFRGKITSVSASDPYATKDPFTVEYEIVQPKFVDWSKKPVRIPALLPQLGLPEPPGNRALAAATSAIDLGTPLDVETHLTLRLPPGTAALMPTGTSVQRDYATFTSKYQEIGDTVTASRRLNFLLREVSAHRAADYNAFIRAVQNDEAQEFTLDRGNAATTQPAAESPKKKD
ncbi:MAG TPA: DUF3857 domain-containing protein [Candidatus Saccharimonadales bacterium]|nr:DUF3857 domain-containing protein [Candidatus Saccharimonadales bacterium]